ncbi:hypothetical protein AB0M02_28880 [Actinoplanes sp. NPDC051861]|uniref:hypothetical protein n=1 Tax=Actinoplanes sp. NPDC051861 TaxID=3155170 RepID=UPI00343384A9
MSADRRRILAVIAVLSVFLAAGVFWLTRLVMAPTEAQFVSGAGSPPTVVTATPLDVESLAATEPSVPRSTTATPTRTPSSRRPTTRPTTTRPTSTRPTTTRPSTTRPTTTSAAPKPKPRTVQVGGVTLNNRNPRTMCTEYENRVGLPLVLSDIDVTGKLTISSRRCAGESDVNGSACREGRTLPVDGFCFVGVVPTTEEPGEYAGTVTVTVTARCTATRPAACRDPAVGDPPPSPERPVLITWVQQPVDTSCHAVRAPGDDSDDFCFPEPP